MLPNHPFVNKYFKTFVPKVCDDFSIIGKMMQRDIEWDNGNFSLVAVLYKRLWTILVKLF